MLKPILDAVLIASAFVFSYYLRFKILLFITPTSLPIFERYLNTMIFITLIWLAIFNLTGLYEKKKFTTLIDEIASLFVGVTLSTMILFGLLFLYRELWFSRLVVVNAWWVSLLLLTVERGVIFSVQRILYRRGIGAKNTLIIGSGEIGKLLALKIQQDKTLGYEFAGFFDGDLPQLKETIRSKNIDEVIFADTQLPMAKILDIITECERYGIEFKLVPGILELIATRVDVDELAGVPLLTVKEIQLKGLNASIKRTADAALSTFGIILLLPLFAAFAALIKMTSAGPIFFKQKRVGLDEKIFEIYKFRSMVKDAEKLFPQLEPLSETEGHIFKMKDDPRITALGKFMRRWSIDELPQLFNVFRGEMSLVGPRPPLPREVEKYSAWHKKRLRVRPGITGLWQVSGRSLLPFEDMVRLDIYYIENWSLWLDIKILFRTLWVVGLKQGAY